MPKTSDRSQSGFIFLIPLIIIAIALAVGAGISVKRAQDDKKLLQQQKSEQQSLNAKLADQHRAAEAKLKAKPAPTPPPATTAPTLPPATITPPAPAKPTPVPAPKPTPAPTPAPAPSSQTVNINGFSYNCADSGWKNIVYAHKAPTDSYASPGGSPLHDYAAYTQITGLSCASTSGWLQRGGEYFNGQDLIVS